MWRSGRRRFWERGWRSGEEDVEFYVFCLLAEAPERVPLEQFETREVRRNDDAVQGPP